jgi:hypothetical protein
MLKHIHLVGFLSGVVLGCAYGWAGPSGCGTALGTMPILFAWLVVAKVLGDIFADQHTWLERAIAAFAHGLLLCFLCWVIDRVIRRFVAEEATVRLLGFACLVTLYAGVLFFVWPLQDCP